MTETKRERNNIRRNGKESDIQEHIQDTEREKKRAKTEDSKKNMFSTFFQSRIGIYYCVFSMASSIRSIHIRNKFIHNM